MAKRETGSQVALLCFVDEYSAYNGTWKNILFCALSIISAIFLITTLAIYILLPELRELQDKAMMAVVTSLAVSYIILSIQILRPSNEEDYHTCVFLGTGDASKRDSVCIHAIHAYATGSSKLIVRLFFQDSFYISALCLFSFG